MPFAKINRSDRKIVEIMQQRRELQDNERSQYDVVEVDQSAKVGDQARDKSQGQQGQQGQQGGQKQGGNT
jgi:hypothetical protein